MKSLQRFNIYPEKRPAGAKKQPIMGTRNLYFRERRSESHLIAYLLSKSKLNAAAPGIVPTNLIFTLGKH